MAALAAAFFLCTGAANAADGIYWANFDGKTISHADLNGGHGGEVPLVGAGVDFPIGVAIDSANGRLYWTNRGSQDIEFANLDGTGFGKLDIPVVIDRPGGLAIDSAAGRIYWADFAASKISFANLRGGGGGGGELDTTGAILGQPNSVAISPGTGRIYWTDLEGADSISYANLAGGGGGRLDTGAAPVSFPEGIAIDPMAGRVYWTNTGNNTIASADLNGGAGATLNTGAAPVDEPLGLAIDPAAGKIYWANFGNDTLAVANLSGGEGHQLDIAGATPVEPAFPVLLRAPSEEGRPQIHGDKRLGAELSCAATPARDLVESFLYRAPQTLTYQWLRNGQPVAGATATTLTAHQFGSYSCRVTATNFAGSDVETSAPVAIGAALRLGKVRLNRANGTATLAVIASGAGKLTLTGAGVKRRVAKARAGARLAVRPLGRARRLLDATGRARVRVKVSFAPTGGETLRRSKTIVLKKR